MFAIGDAEYPGLSKVTEEAGELLQVIGKLIANQGRAQHWDGSNLRSCLIYEAADLSAALHFVIKTVLTSDERDFLMRRFREKYERFRAWHALGPGQLGASPPPLCSFCEKNRIDGIRNGMAGFVMCAECGRARAAIGDPP